mmetsp:Transcript_66619/g.124331  ORF Transcript_66619/g.124331 Transcript_66619/m.124331 type:complete len:696 (-) Transcript_66619:55-2142(-)
MAWAQLCCGWRVRRALSFVPLLTLAACSLLHNWVSSALIKPPQEDAIGSTFKLRHRSGEEEGEGEVRQTSVTSSVFPQIKVEVPRYHLASDAQETTTEPVTEAVQHSTASMSTSALLRPPATEVAVTSTQQIETYVLEAMSVSNLTLEAPTRAPQKEYEEAVAQYMGKLPEPVKSSTPRAFSPEVTDRHWGEDRRCAFITLLMARQDTSKYAAFLEAATRIRLTFAFEREYPHIVFHEGNLPISHQRFIQERVPAVLFHNIGHLFHRPSWTPPRSDWVATDRSEGYRNMCRFYIVQLYAVMAQLGFDAFLRVDDDVFMLMRADYDPFRRLFEQGLVYMFGTLQEEKHDWTPLSLPPWLTSYCESFQWSQPKNCSSLAASVISDMFFSNLFISRLSFWMQPDVVRFLHDVDHSNNIYVQRWGDAPIQAAAVRLFAAPELAQRFPQLIYVHNSGQNLVFPGGLTNCLACPEASRVLILVTRMLSSGPILAGHRLRVAAAHAVTWKQDLLQTNITPAVWDERVLLGIDDDTLLKVVADIGVWCDGAEAIHEVWLMPRYCCCHLDTYRTKPQAVEQVSKKVLTVAVKHIGLRALVMSTSAAHLAAEKRTRIAGPAPVASASGHASPLASQRRSPGGGLRRPSSSSHVAGVWASAAGGRLPAGLPPVADHGHQAAATPEETAALTLAMSDLPGIRSSRHT